MAEIKTIGVVGAGQMGSGIAQLAAVNGVDVWLHDTDAEALTRAQNSISNNTQRLVSKGHLSQDVIADASKRLQCTFNLDDFHSVDLVIDAIVESEDVKKKLFVQLDKIVKRPAILASNTSSISITRLAPATSRPSPVSFTSLSVISMHFMNSPPIMKLVEIIKGADTSDDTYNATRVLAERFGRTVICSNDYPGFIVNRILMPMINEAFHALHAGVATKEGIDTGMKLGINGWVL